MMSVVIGKCEEPCPSDRDPLWRDSDDHAHAWLHDPRRPAGAIQRTHNAEPAGSDQHRLPGGHDFWRRDSFYTSVPGHQTIGERRRILHIRLFKLVDCQHPQNTILVSSHRPVYRIL